MTKKEVDISIIIPVYNVEAYLRECLDSVIKQDCEKFEIVCVNDGSTDNSPCILDEYEKKYSFIHVYTKENGGLSSARNYGMQRANGRYIFFLDSDDMLADESCMSFIVENMDSYCLDVMYFDGKSFFEDEAIRQLNTSYEVAYQRRKSYGLYQKGKELFAHLVQNGDYYVQSSLQCLSREFLIKNKLSYLEGILYEDNLFTFKVMMIAKRVMHINRIVLLRRIRSGSIMQSKLKFQNIYSLFILYQDMIQFCRYHINDMYVDKEIAMVLNSIRSFAMSVYRKIEIDEKYNILNLPAYEQALISIYFSPNDKVISNTHFFPYHLFHNGNRILLYGAGNIGKKFYYQASNDRIVDIVGIIDLKALEMKNSDIPVLPVPMIRQLDYDYVLIAVENSNTAKEIKENLIEMGVPCNKIKWDGDVYFKDNYHRKSYEYHKLANRFMQSVRKRFFLFMLPEHGNLGDYAIGMAEKQFFDDYFPEFQLICVTTNEWGEFKEHFMENINKTDVLFITGGGFIGDMWSSYSVCKDILQAFPQNRKIFMPNTLTYHNIHKREIVCNDLQQLFSDDNTYVFLREYNSLKVCTEFGWEDKCYCFPDMVLYLKYEKRRQKRNGKVLLCFRTDAEKVFRAIDNVKKLLTQNQIQYDEIDTHLYRYVPEPEGDLRVNDLLRKFEEYDLVITDRLHGMLLAYVSETPCIAFDNSTHKVSGVYEWIKDESGVEFLEKYDEDKIKRLVIKYQKEVVTYCKKPELSKQFFLIKETIKKLTFDNYLNLV